MVYEERIADGSITEDELLFRREVMENLEERAPMKKVVREGFGDFRDYVVDGVQRLLKWRKGDKSEK